MKIIILILIMVCAITVNAEEAREIYYTSSGDNSKQPAMFYAPVSEKAVPLIVALHKWNGNYKRLQNKPIEQWSIENGWAYIHPNFRGRNQRPEATGSELVVTDIVDAVKYAQSTANIDSSAIYLVSAPTGGYTALLMAGRYPEIWAGVSAWLPVSDLRALHAQGKFIGAIEKSTGGAPGENSAVDAEYAKRSPVTHLKKAKGVNLHINAAINDTIIPISHSLLAFNELAAEEDQISAEDIKFFVEEAKVPQQLRVDVSDPAYGKKSPIFQKKSGNTTVNIFDGHHIRVNPLTIAWLEQIRKQKGNKAASDKDE